MAEPHSALHLTGWLAVIVVGAICVAPTGHGVRDTFFYKYRPAHHPVLSPALIGFIWLAALVLFAVSWVYLLTTTSNTGNWCDRLFPNQKNPWDGMLALYLVIVIFIKMWNPFVYWLDDQYVYWYGRRQLEGSDKNKPRALIRKEEMSTVGNDTINTFTEKQDTYYVNNNVVRWGMVFYATALVALLVTVIAFYSRLYAEQKNDHQFKIIYWTVFVAFLVSVFGWIMTCISVFWYSDAQTRRKEMEGEPLAIRNIQNQA